jgi:hypothetical protein
LVRYGFAVLAVVVAFIARASMTRLTGGSFQIRLMGGACC